MPIHRLTKSQKLVFVSTTKINGNWRKRQWKKNDTKGRGCFVGGEKAVTFSISKAPRANSRVISLYLEASSHVQFCGSIHHVGPSIGPSVDNAIFLNTRKRVFLTNICLTIIVTSLLIHKL